MCFAIERGGKNDEAPPPFARSRKGEGLVANAILQVGASRAHRPSSADARGDAREKRSQRYSMMPRSKARMRTVAARPRWTSSPGASVRVPSAFS